MAFLFSKAKWAIGRKKVDLEAEDLSLLLVMEDSTVPDQEDVEFLSEFTDLDEYDGANYPRKTLANKALAQDLVANVARLTADDLAWIGLGAGTRKCIGALLFAEAASDALRRPPLRFTMKAGTAPGADFFTRSSSPAPSALRPVGIRRLSVTAGSP